MLYFDYPATTPIDEEVLKSQVEVSKSFFANTESNHALGQRSKRLLLHLQEELERMIGGNFEYIFTSGATEANIIGLNSLAKKNKSKGTRILYLSIEHASINATIEKLQGEGYSVEKIAVDKKGVIDFEKFVKQLSSDVILCSIMAVNNEIGSIQDLTKVKNLMEIHAPHGTLFSDCVQGIGKVKIDFNSIDAFSMTAHKIFGPKGVGILAIPKGMKIQSDRVGGQHQNGHRAGTIPLPLCVACVKSIQKMFEEFEVINLQMIEKFNYTITKLNEIGMHSQTFTSNQSPYIISTYSEKIRAIPLQQYLSDLEIYVGTQSACSEGANKQSHVLKAIGLPTENAQNVIRIGIAPQTTFEEIDILIDAIQKGINQFGL